MTSTAIAPKLFATRPASRVLLDVAIAATALAGTLSQISHGGIIPTRSGAGGLDPISVVLAVCATAPLIGWRRFPLGAFAMTAAASVLLGGLGYPLDLTLGPTAALFLLAASRGRDAPWAGRTTAVILGFLVAYLIATAAAQAAFPGVELLHTGLASSLAWFAGERTRLRREQMAELRERVQRTERDAQRERLLAVAEERARIARDLHDSAGHAISVIAVRSGAARLRHDPDRSLAALEAIEELARQTAEEINQIVVTLRDGDATIGAVKAPPGLASLDSLIAHYAAAGLDVTVERTGPERQLGGVADQAAYRILQEALTNAARYGTGTASISLSFGDRALEFTVTNPVATTNTPSPGGGHGLIGMRERATLLGGSVDVHQSDGVYQVQGRIPYGGHRT